MHLRSYIRAGLALIPIPRGAKGPNTKGWDLAENCITDEDVAVQLRSNVGLAHAYGSPPTCALDIDQMDKAVVWLEGYGISLPGLLDSPTSVQIISGMPNKGKLIFRLPPGTSPLATKKIHDSSGAVIIEFRCATASGKTVQDVLPPSVHPATNRQYRWGGSGYLTEIPIAPDALIEIWKGLIQPGHSNNSRTTHTNSLHAINATQGVDDETTAVARGEVFEYSEANQLKLNAAIDSLLANFRTGIAYDDWFKCACEFKSLINEGWPEEIVWPLFDSFSARAGGNYDQVDNLKHWHQIRIAGNNIRTWRSLLRGSADRPGHLTSGVTRYEDHIDRSDYGNAILLRNLANGDLRFCHEAKTTYTWTGNRWEECRNGSALQRAAIKVAQKYSKDYEKLNAELKGKKDLTDEDKTRWKKKLKDLSAWVITCRNKHRLASMESLAVKMPEIIINIEKLNVDRYLLGVQNGVIDLLTGSLRSAAREDLVTKYCGTMYIPTAASPRWLKFIEEITGSPIDPNLDRSGEVMRKTVGLYHPRPHLARYLQKLVGYFATGLVREDKMIFFTGCGGNGKDIFINTLLRVLHDYACTMPPTALMTNKGDGDPERPSPILARLAGCRVAFSSEAKDGQQLDVSLLKRHTGGGKLVARLLQENAIEFEISHKLVLATNVVPPFDHLDDAMRSRIHIVPFDRQWNRPGVTDPDPALPDGDKTLNDVLKSEDEGILTWIIEGAVAYFREGLSPPDEVVARTLGYIKEQDCFEPWFAQFEICSARRGISGADLFADFKGFCRSRGQQPIPASTQTFAKRLRESGAVREQLREGNYWGLTRRLPTMNFEC